MAEFIEREKALEECDWYANEFCECEYAIMPLKGALEILPAADVRPVVRGKWKKAPCHETDEAYTYICPFCRWYMIAIEPMNFCPNCGADMREGS